MKKNLTLLAIIVCCAFACPSTNCFAQGRFLRALPMAAARATMQFDNLQENIRRKTTAELERQMAATRLERQMAATRLERQIAAARLERQIAAARLERQITAAKWKSEHNSRFSSGKGINSYKPSKIKELLLSTEKSNLPITRATAVELSPAEFKKGDSLPHAKDFKMRQLAAEAEEWAEPQGQVASPQNPDNR